MDNCLSGCISFVGTLVLLSFRPGHFLVSWVLTSAEGQCRGPYGGYRVGPSFPSEGPPFEV